MSIVARPAVFERPDASFEMDPRALDWILGDEANPLNHIVRLIPSGARILDVGVGNGILARLLQKVGKAVEIHGIEPNGVAACLAEPFYATLFREPLERFLSQAEASPSYDIIVLADVVEHLVHPEPALRALRRYLVPSGRIYLSTPNIAFAAVRLALLNGNFEYVDSGILERTHVRFFTLKSLRMLFASTDLFPHVTMLLHRSPMLTEIRLENYPISPWLYWRVMRDHLASVYQFLVVLGTAPGPSITQSHGSHRPLDYLWYLKRRLVDRGPPNAA